MCILLQVQMGSQSVLVLPASSYSWILSPLFFMCGWSLCQGPILHSSPDAVHVHHERVMLRSVFLVLCFILTS